MTEKEMWKAFCEESGNDNDNYEAWAFGDDADRLAGPGGALSVRHAEKA